MKEEENEKKERSDHLFYKIVWNLAKFFYPKTTVQGAENIPDEPSIIVGNHAQVHGAIAGELYFPGKRFIWCIGEMMHCKEVPDYAYQDFWSMKPKWSKPFFRLLSYIIAPIASAILSHGDTIGVYHDSRVLKTFKETVARLQEGYHIIIYPESHAGGYNQILYQFQENFVDVAKLYYRRTGKALSFVPMYLAPRLRLMCFAAPVAFDPEAPIDQERRRICQAMMDGITALAEALPEHTVVPYPNMPKKNYPTNHAKEVIQP